MVKVIIIDDEPSAIKSMEWELKHFCKNVLLMGTFSNAIDAINYLKVNDIDCIFLDIEMPEMDGFQFLEIFPERSFSIIITTAYDQYAIKAIKEKALDYLLKPIDSDDLIECVEKMKAIKSSTNLNDKLEKTLENLMLKSQTYQRKISVSCDGKLIFLDQEDIVYCESDGNYCTVYLENKEIILLTQKLKFMEEKLINSNFFRIHNSYLINLNKVKEYHRNDSYVVLSNHIKLPVSRLKKDTFLNKL